MQIVDKEQAGFTLIEIMIALMIVSIALGAVISSSGNSIVHASYVKDKSMALWVAQNSIQLSRAKKEWLSPGETVENITLAEKSWQVKKHIINTPEVNIRKMVVTVISHDEELHTLTTFLYKPN